MRSALKFSCGRWVIEKVSCIVNDCHWGWIDSRENKYDVLSIDDFNNITHWTITKTNNIFDNYNALDWLLINIIMFSWAGHRPTPIYQARSTWYANPLRPACHGRGACSCIFCSQSTRYSCRFWWSRFPLRSPGPAAPHWETRSSRILRLFCGLWAAACWWLWLHRLRLPTPRHGRYPGYSYWMAERGTYKMLSWDHPDTFQLLADLCRTPPRILPQAYDSAGTTWVTQTRVISWLSSINM